MSKKLTLIAALFLASVAMGWAMSPRSSMTDVAQAACGVAIVPGNCLTNDSTMAGVIVNHVDVNDHEPSIVTPVEPDDTDSWTITALYSTDDMAVPGSCICEDYNASVTADVTWTGTDWSVSCTGCSFPSGPILSVSVCDEDSCASGGIPNEQHGWKYRLVARVSELHNAG